MLNKFKNPPKILLGKPNWVVHKNKIPYDPKSDRPARAGYPETWGTHSQAIEAYESGNYDGIGFELDGSDIVFTDFDDCFDTQTGELVEAATNELKKNASYAEISPSGKGVHIYSIAEIPVDGRKDSKKKLGFMIEVYQNKRYFTFTGDNIEGHDEIIEAQSAVEDLYFRLFGKEQIKILSTDSIGEASVGWLEDGLRRSPSFRAIWEGERKSEDESSCDMSLMCHLAMWAEGDVKAMKQAFLASPFIQSKDELHMKKLERPDYIEMTARKAVKGQLEMIANDFDDSDDYRKWTEPSPLQEAFPEAFDSSWLPGFLGNYAREVAASLQISTDLIAAGVLSVIAMSVAGKYEIQGKLGYIEPLNIFTLLVASPGERKSALFKEILAPVYDFETAENGERKSEIARCKSERKIFEGKLKAAQEVAIKAPDSSEKREKALIMAEEFEELEDISALRLTIDDVTPEKIVSLLVEQDGRIAFFSAEGGLFSQLNGRYNKCPSLDVLLKGHAGDILRVDRVGRASETVESPAITIALGVQPQIIKEIMNDQGFLEKGLVARFLIVWPESGLGSRRFDSPEISRDHRYRYHGLIRELLEKKESNKGVIELTEEARNELIQFFNEVEVILVERTLGNLNSFVAKLVGLVLRLAGLLHCAEHASNPVVTYVSKETMQNAILIGRWALAHARRTYGASKFSDLEEANYVVGRVSNSHSENTITCRELMRICQRYKSMHELEPIINTLLELGYLRPTVLKKTSKIVYELNPYYFKYIPAC